MIQIEKIPQDTAEKLCRKITADLPEYFGLPDANEQYAVGVRSRQNFAAKIRDGYNGLISLDFPYPTTCNIYWMGVLRDHQGKGVGHKLLESAYGFAKESGAKTMVVETLAPLECDANYLKTYKFYQANGFAPLINLKPQGYEWNMVYMIKTLAIVDATKPDMNISIRDFAAADIKIMADAFQKANWAKPASTFETYFQEQLRSER